MQNLKAGTKPAFTAKIEFGGNTGGLFPSKAQAACNAGLHTLGSKTAVNFMAALIKATRLLISTTSFDVEATSRKAKVAASIADRFSAVSAERLASDRVLRDASQIQNAVAELPAAGVRLVLSGTDNAAKLMQEHWLGSFNGSITKRMAATAAQASM